MLKGLPNLPEHIHGTKLEQKLWPNCPFAVQALVFGCIILLTLFLMVKSGSFIDAIPIITLYAFAGYRLMPSFQQIYSSIALLRYAGPALDSLYDDMKRLKPLIAKDENVQEDVKFNENISLNDINFQYPNASRTSLKKINLEISAIQL